MSARAVKKRGGQLIFYSDDLFTWGWNPRIVSVESWKNQTQDSPETRNQDTAKPTSEDFIEKLRKGCHNASEDHRRRHGR